MRRRPANLKLAVAILHYAGHETLAAGKGKGDGHLFAFMRDITERKLAEAKINQRTAR